MDTLNTSINQLPFSPLAFVICITIKIHVCEEISGYFVVSARNCLASMLNNIVMQMRKIDVLRPSPPSFFLSLAVFFARPQPTESLEQVSVMKTTVQRKLFKFKWPQVSFCFNRKQTSMARVPYNKLLTNLATSSGRTRKYWPSVVFLYAWSVLPRTNISQYSPQLVKDG